MHGSAGFIAGGDPSLKKKLGSILVSRASAQQDDQWGETCVKES